MILGFCWGFFLPPCLWDPQTARWKGSKNLQDLFNVYKKKRRQEMFRIRQGPVQEEKKKKTLWRRLDKTRPISSCLFDSFRKLWPVVEKWKVAKGAPGLDHIKITKRAGFFGYVPRLIPRFPSGQKTFRCGRGKNTERNRTKIQNQFSNRQHLTRVSWNGRKSRVLFFALTHTVQCDCSTWP